MVIYDNIPAATAGPVSLSLTGNESVISLRATTWGSTKVMIETYNANDQFPIKMWEIMGSPINCNVDIPPGAIGRGMLFYFTVIDADPATTDLLVNVYTPDYCMTEERENIARVHP